MTAHVVESYDRQFPTFQINSYPWWARAYKALCFLPKAFRAIEGRKLAPEFSFHLFNTQANLIGISHGDIRYPAAAGELTRLEPLIVQLEDKRFFSHVGVDLLGIARATVVNLRFMRISQGGSTITQQLVRNTLLVSERSVLRKLLEAVLAIKVERHFTKQEILNLYCNHVYLGNGIRGFPAAAKIIFRRKLSSLSDFQICGLLALLRTPERTFPKKYSPEFTKRQHKVSKFLNIPPGESDRFTANPNPIRIADYRSPRLTCVVKAELNRLVGSIPRDVRRIGLTLNSTVHSCLNETLCEVSKRPEITSIAGIVLSTATADVLAEGSWRSGVDTPFSPSYFGSLQPGSTFKTFALLSALQQGVPLTQSLLSAPFESVCYQGLNNRPWRVRNYANSYRGSLSLIEAFKCSDNTAFARLAEILDAQQMYQVYKAFGLNRGVRSSPAIVLGGHRNGINLLTLASAYRAIARGGAYRCPRIVRYLEFSDGSHHFLPRADENQIVQEAKPLWDLQGALASAGSFLGSVPIAGKTGTTSTGSLFVGYNDQIASAIWVGYKGAMPEGDPKAINATTTFERFMNRLLGHRADLLSI